MSHVEACRKVELFLRRSARQERIAPFMAAFPIYDELVQAIDGMGVADRVEACFADGSLWLMKKGA